MCRPHRHYKDVLTRDLKSGGGREGGRGEVGREGGR